MIPNTLGRRLIKWFFLNLFALMPLAASLTARFLVGGLQIEDFQNNLSEVLFFALMISISAVSDMDEINQPLKGDLLITAIRSFLLLGAAWSAILYGFFVLNSLSNGSFPEFLSRLIWLAIGTASILFIVSTSAQILISQVVLTPKPTGRKKP